MNLGERIKEEVEALGFNAESFSEHYDFPVAVVYEWFRNENQPNLQNIIRLADLFKCSVDYLLDNEPKYENAVFKQCPPFSTQLTKILKEFKTNKFAVSKATSLSRTSLYDWEEGKKEPALSSLSKLASHFGITIDYLIGRQ